MLTYRAAGREHALPRRIEADVAALRWREAVVKRKLKRRRRTAEPAAQDVPGRRNDHGDNLSEAESAAKQQRMLNNIDDWAGRSDRARRGRQRGNRAADGFIPLWTNQRQLRNLRTSAARSCSLTCP
jgi:hypothetical protein